jgi:hypothetical protein
VYGVENVRRPAPREQRASQVRWSLGAPAREHRASRVNVAPRAPTWDGVEGRRGRFDRIEQLKPTAFPSRFNLTLRLWGVASCYLLVSVSNFGALVEMKDIVTSGLRRSLLLLAVPRKGRHRGKSLSSTPGRWL